MHFDGDHHLHHDFFMANLSHGASFGEHADIDTLHNEIDQLHGKIGQMAE
jgi:hypothetical protein